MKNRKEVVMEGKGDLVSSFKCYLIGASLNRVGRSVVDNSCSSIAKWLYKKKGAPFGC